MKKIKCVDLFCGAGGLTHGFALEGIDVVAGIDLDPACRYPYEKNNQAKFIETDVAKVSADIQDGETHVILTRTKVTPEFGMQCYTRYPIY